MSGSRHFEGTMRTTVSVFQHTPSSISNSTQISARTRYADIMYIHPDTIRIPRKGQSQRAEAQQEKAHNANTIPSLTADKRPSIPQEIC